MLSTRVPEARKLLLHYKSTFLLMLLCLVAFVASGLVGVCGNSTFPVHLDAVQCTSMKQRTAGNSDAAACLRVCCNEPGCKVFRIVKGIDKNSQEFQ